MVVCQFDEEERKLDWWLGVTSFRNAETTERLNLVEEKM